MEKGTPKLKRAARLLASVVVGLVLVVWVASRWPQEEFTRRTEPGRANDFAATANVFAEELPLQAEASLAGSKLPLYELKIGLAELRAIQSAAYDNSAYPATFTADGKIYEGVKVRARGSWSRSWPKKSLKILFDHQNAFGGHHSLNLNSAWRDPAFVREVLAYKVYAACGVPASRAQMVRLQVNGRFRGLYVEVEQPDKEFLSHHKLKGAALYKALSRPGDADERDLGDEQSYHMNYTKETKKTANYDELARFCHELANATDTLAFLNQHVDVSEYINYLAATVLIQHWDGFNKNHYLAYDAEGTGKWSVIPWDLDRTLGDHWNQTFGEVRFPIVLGTRARPGVTGWNRLEDRFFSDPTLRMRLLDRLSELLDTEFTTAKLFPLLDELEDEISPAAKLDRIRWPGPTGDVHNGIAGVKSFIERRRAYLLAEIPKLRRQWGG